MIKYGVFCAVGVMLSSGAFAQADIKTGNQTSEKDYYFASSNSKNRYFFNRSSIHERSDIGPKVKGLQSLWVPLTAPASHPTLSYIELDMVADCTTEGKIGLLRATGYDKNNTIVQKEEVPVKSFEWMAATDQTSFNVNWKAACTNIVWPSPARFEGLSSAQVAEKAHQNSVLWNPPAK